ncbi:substrate-binding domain-containing protein [Paraburkholderia megapolitana]|uniref:Monosaccharide ABC transporter substrate-binding protein, CUT2 family n=1 Tax=Paraburkholderia megapolitana TaxID=420953 RepID=A0A1I3TQX2_9BURK|nr:substrate-binding domain-containing protein [Paraburkholderia megapolitana]QDQ83456.1 substrate-binding domain-containing protein [Paraburkholderia megapolitana]SFJ71947.1 monosaccharide ABC transporter substrate-binding protein, CUT2 family [Paraburkholderia megapolitana]
MQRFGKVLALAVLLASGFASLHAQAKQPVIAGIVFQQDQYFRTVQIGLRDAAQAAGAQLLEGDSDNKLEKESQLIDTYIARGVDAIVIAPISAKGSVNALQRARAKGIKVVTYGTSVNGDLAQVSVVSSDRELGQSTGDATRQYLQSVLAPGAKAQIATVAFKSQVPEQSDARVGGFLEKAGPSVTVVAQQDAWLPEKAVAVVGDIITAHPGVQVIFAANEGGTVGAVQAVKNAGKAGKIVVFGIDGTEQTAKALLSRDNILQAVTAQQPYLLGKNALNAAVALIDAKPVDTKIVVPSRLLTRQNPKQVQDFLAEIKKY